jgi:hypothetical protein
VDPILTTPSLEAFDIACDVDLGAWTGTATATSWTGGGALWWTVDGDYVEAHSVRSQVAEADGSGDQLGISLTVVGDWREAASGSATAFHCDEDPSLRFVVYDTLGEIADCVDGGPSPDLLDALEDVPGCGAT